MHKTLIKLYVEMPDGMTVEHYTDKAPVELADAMQRLLTHWSQHQRVPSVLGGSGLPDPDFFEVSPNPAHQRAETVQKQVGAINV